MIKMRGWMGAGITSGGGHVTRIGSCSSGGLKLIKRRRRRSRATSGRPPQFLTLKSFQTNSIYPLIAGCIRPELPSISINFHQFFPLSPGLRPELRHHWRAVDPIQDRILIRIGSRSIELGPFHGLSVGSGWKMRMKWAPGGRKTGNIDGI